MGPLSDGSNDNVSAQAPSPAQGGTMSGQAGSPLGPQMAPVQNPGLWSNLGNNLSQNFGTPKGLAGVGSALGGLAQQNNAVLAQNFAAVQSGMPVKGFNDIAQNMNPQTQQALSTNPQYQTGLQHGIQGVLALFQKLHQQFQKGSGVGGSQQQQTDQELQSLNPADLSDGDDGGS